MVLSFVALGGCKPVGPDCGDLFCDSRFETATNCPADCGGSVCGRFGCEAGENCSTCPSDCGSCTGCGDGLCQTTVGESCSTCPGDCGACGDCGDGFCQTAIGESCSTCPGDCGGCGSVADPYESCGGSTTCVAGETCTPIMNGTTTQNMCTNSCTNDGDCDLDMFGSPGDCVFYGGVGTCFHRCVDSGDCYVGFACYTPTGSTGALGTICLPDDGPPGPTVQPYDRCSTSADCIGGLECINYFIPPGGDENLCSASGCFDDDDCPFDSRGGRGACFSFDGGATRACWERCNVRADCVDTVEFDCTTAVGGFTAPVPVCVPR